MLSIHQTHTYVLPCLNSPPPPFVIQLVVSSVALLVYSTAELISHFMADLQPDRQTENMAAALSLLLTQGLVKGGIRHTTHA